MTAPDENARAAALLERLLTDPLLRADFRRRPATTCRAFELDDLADELESGARGTATIEQRESRSGMAGVMVAAGFEGVGLGELLARHAMHAIGDTAQAAARLIDQVTDGSGAAAPISADAGGAPSPATAGAVVPAVAPVPPAPASGPAPANLLASDVAPAAAALPGSVAAAHAGAEPSGLPAAVAASAAAPSASALAPAAPAGGPSALPPTPGAAATVLPASPGSGSVAPTPSPGFDGAAPPATSGPGPASPPAAAPSASDEVLTPKQAGDSGSTVLAAANGPGDPAGLPGAATAPPAAGATVDPTTGAPATTVDPTTGAPATTVDPTTGAPATTVDPTTGAPATTVDPTTGLGASPTSTTPGAQGAPGAPATAAERDEIVATRNHAREISPESLEPSGETGARGYPGDGASKAQIAGWMARRAAAAGVPPELPVMASLVESGLANLNHGDRDSVGYFQMRVGIWNRGPYSGYPDNANLQLKWFLDQATALKSARVGAGDRDFGSDPSTWGNWIADVERPDERYRYRYQQQLDAARELLRGHRDSTSLAARTASAEPSVEGSSVSAAALAANAREIDPGATGGTATTSGERAVHLAKQYLGRPYVWGGETPASGFDCSGLVQYVYKQLGVDLPRVTDQQFEVGKVVGRGDLRTGDIVFFRDASGYIHHEGLYLSDGRFLHAPHTGDVIKISSLDEPYYTEQFAGGRRVGEGASAAVAAIDLTRRSAGDIVTARVHDARVMPVLDPSAPRPAG
jgi:cell wall-associated NlpC family hydrolase